MNSVRENHFPGPDQLLLLRPVNSGADSIGDVSVKITGQNYTFEVLEVYAGVMSFDNRIIRGVDDILNAMHTAGNN